MVLHLNHSGVPSQANVAHDLCPNLSCVPILCWLCVIALMPHYQFLSYACIDFQLVHNFTGSSSTCLCTSAHLPMCMYLSSIPYRTCIQVFELTGECVYLCVRRNFLEFLAVCDTRQSSYSPHTNNRPIPFDISCLCDIVIKNFAGWTFHIVTFKVVAPLVEWFSTVIIDWASRTLNERVQINASICVCERSLTWIATWSVCGQV